MDKPPNPHRELSEKLGDLCAHWAALDRTLDVLFEPMLKCDKAKVACITASLDNFAARCEVLKRLITHEPPSDRWRDWLIVMLDFLGGRVAALRNRYIHDTWLVGEGEMARMDKRAFRKKQPERLEFDITYPDGLPQIHTLIATVWNCKGMMGIAEGELRKWRQTGQIEELAPQLVEWSSCYFPMLGIQWPQAARHLLPEPSDPNKDDELRQKIANSYIVRSE